MTEFAITFTGDPKAFKDKFLHYGDVQMDSNTGFVMPFDGRSIVFISTNQDGNDDSDVDLLVNDVLVETLVVVNRDHIFPVNIPLDELDRLTAFNQNDNDLDDFTMTLFFDFDVPPPVAGIEVGDIVNVTLAGQGRVLSIHEVLKLPDLAQDYWVFQAPNGEIIAAEEPTAVTKLP